MNIKKHSIQSCCGKTTIIFKTGCPLDKTHLEFLKSKGFRESIHFTKAGILYVDNLEFTLNGPFGSDRLMVNCKRVDADCDQKINDLEVLLQQME